MPFPRIDEATRAYFDSLVPDDPRVQVRPMFGNVGAFVNGNMFMGVLDEAVLVRLPEEARAELLSTEDASVPEPVPGRPMKEYVTIPATWREHPETARDWVRRSLDWAGRLPEKNPKKSKKKS